jgi:hypothetical protein
VTRCLISLQTEYEQLWEPYLLMGWFFSDFGSETTFLVRRLHGRKADTTGFADAELDTADGVTIALGITMLSVR